MRTAQEQLAALATHRLATGLGAVRPVAAIAAGQTWAWWSESNPLAPGGGFTHPGADASEPAIISPGWLTDPDGPPDEPAFATWTARGWGAMDAWLATVSAPSTLLRPHAGAVLGDAQAIATFLKRDVRAGARAHRVVLDPVALLTPGMMGRAADHLRRIVEAVGGHERIAALVLPTMTLGDEAAAILLEAAASVRARGLPVIERGG